MYLVAKNALAVFYPFSTGTVFYPFSRFLEPFSTRFLGTVFYPFSGTVFCPFSGADVNRFLSVFCPFSGAVVRFLPVFWEPFSARFLSVLWGPFFYPFCGDRFLPVFTFSPQEGLRGENE